MNLRVALLLLLLMSGLHAEPVFVGIMTTPSDGTLYSIAPTEKSHTRWVKLGERVSGYLVSEFHAEEEVIVLVKAGREFHVKLRESKVRTGGSGTAQSKPAARVSSARATTEQPLRPWVKITLVRLADDHRKEAKLGPIFLRENSSVRFTSQHKSDRVVAVYVSPRLTADGAVLAISSTDDKPDPLAEEKSRLIAMPLNKPTEFELQSGKFRAVVTLEAPRGAIQPAI
jgi:hypothetical protein